MKRLIRITVYIPVLLLCAFFFTHADTPSDANANVSADDSLTVHPAPKSLPRSEETVTHTLPERTHAGQKAQDSAAQDTTDMAERRQFFLETNAYFRERYQRYPATIDSLFNPRHVYPFRIFQADGMNLSDILGHHPLFVTVPVTLGSNLNRFLYYGLPADHVSLHPGSGIFGAPADPGVGRNLSSAAETEGLAVTTPGTIRFELQPSTITRGETGILWESGVFKENTLNIRFARPLAHNLHLGIFSNYQHFRRQNYFHGNGIYAFYRPVYESIGLDSSYVSGKGTNPLTNEHVTAIRLAWRAKNGAAAGLTYKYADLRNDLAAEYPVRRDTLSLIRDASRLVWEERTHYSHTVSAAAHSFPLTPRIDINAEAMMQNNVNRLKPLSPDYRTRRGENFLAGGALRPGIRLGDNDSLLIEFGTQRDDRTRVDNRTWVTHHTRSAAAYIRNYRIGPLTGGVHCALGYCFVKLNGTLEHTPVYTFTVSNTFAGQHLKLYALQDILPPVVPYDTLFPVVPGNLMNRYQSIGAEGFFRYKKAGVILGACIINNIDSSSVVKAWPNGIPPYQAPGWVLMATPVFGKWRGFSVSSQWLFSERKPFVKSKNLVSFHNNREGKATHLCIDLGFDYWSERDSIHYAGIDTWHRPILDLHVKTAVQIQTFRIFYKIDNLFNGNFAYVPGYYMPGLVFRWGFNWLIQG